jgi:RimJ/RimL family protein N-acetyltransferase
MAAVGGPIDMSSDQADAWFARYVDPGNPADRYRLIIDPSGNPVGEISCHRMDWKTMTAEFNLKVQHSVRGRGYGTAAMLIFLREFFVDLGGREMVDPIAVGNVAGQEALIKFGFEHDSTRDGIMVLRMSAERFQELHGEV